MAGSIDYTALFSNTSADSTSLLSILYSTATQVSQDPIADLKLAERNQTKDVTIQAKDPATARDVAAFRAAIAKAPDIKTALSNPAVLKVLLTANGLASQLGFTALATKALLSDPADPKSLVNRLSNTTWKSVAQTFQFSAKGLAALQDPKVQQSVADGYAEVVWRTSLDAKTPGLSNALTFRTLASTATSADAILGDAVLRDVITTALGIPRQIAFQDLPAQEKAITDHLDIKKLADPHFVDGLTQQYLLAKASAASGAASNGTKSTAGLLV